jgi:DNA (cytosine-5)-methyltransferase 1
MDLGFKQSGGFRIMVANELWKPATETYRLNHPTTTLIEGDITKEETKKAICACFDQDPCEAIVGCPPCQSFSVAGKRDEDDPRGALYEDYLNLVRRLHPIVVVMENVPGILTMLRPDGMPVMRRISKRLKQLGYAVGYRRLNAADFGVPQARVRVFIIAWRSGGIPRIEATHDEHGRNGLPPRRTLRDALDGLPGSPVDHLLFPEKMLRFFIMIKPGQNWHHLPEHLQTEAVGEHTNWAGGGTACYRRLSWDRPSPTLVCSPIQKLTTLCHPDEDRPLSVQEYMRIQQFPDDYEMRGSIADQYAQLGNAVPVGLARAVAMAVREALPDDPGEGKPSKEHLLSNGISKKGPQVLAWSIAMPQGKCPFASNICAKYCYANRGRFLWNTRCYARNLVIAQQDDFVDRVCEELRHATRGNPETTVSCAIHEKGDFFSLSYLESWHEIIRRMRPWSGVRFFVYTRSWISGAFMDGLRRLGTEPTVRVNLSTDRETLAAQGVPPRIGNGLVTYLAETDDDVPTHPVDIVFRNLCNKPTSPLEYIGGCLVCPHESNLYFENPKDGTPTRIRCQLCRLCVDRDPEEWVRVKPSYAGIPDIEGATAVTPVREPSQPGVTVSS